MDVEPLFPCEVGLDRRRRALLVPTVEQVVLADVQRSGIGSERLFLRYDPESDVPMYLHDREPESARKRRLRRVPGLDAQSLEPLAERLRDLAAAGGFRHDKSKTTRTVHRFAAPCSLLVDRVYAWCVYTRRVMPTIRGEIGKRIRFARTELAVMRVAELAAELGVLTITVYRWENGKSRASLETLEQIALALRVSLPWLLTGQGEARAAA